MSCSVIRNNERCLKPNTSLLNYYGTPKKGESLCDTYTDNLSVNPLWQKNKSLFRQRITAGLGKKKVLELTSAFGVYLRTPAVRSLDWGNQKPETEQAKPKTALDTRPEKPVVFWPKTENQMLKKGKTRNRKSHKNRKTGLKSGQNRKSQRPPRYVTLALRGVINYLFLVWSNYILPSIFFPYTSRK